MYRNRFTALRSASACCIVWVQQQRHCLPCRCIGLRPSASCLLRRRCLQIIFIDEIDALAPARGGSGGSQASSASSARLVATLLTEMDQLGGEGVKRAGRILLLSIKQHGALIASSNAAPALMLQPHG
jgi:hypothetical protein